MHVIVCKVAGQHYAVDTRPVLEVIPMVETQPMAHARPSVLGLINYRGNLITLFCMATLLGHAPCEPRRSCRILVVQVPDSRTAQDSLIGLLFEQLLGIEDLDFQHDSGHTGVDTPGVDFLGSVALTEFGSVQLVDPCKLQRTLGTKS